MWVVIEQTRVDFVCWVIKLSVTFSKASCGFPDLSHSSTGVLTGLKMAGCEFT